MRLLTLLLFVGLSTVVSAQTRQQALEKFNDLRAQAVIQEKIILSPDENDFAAAAKQNVSVFRILPRETYDKGLFTTRGGGAYYSFYYKIHDYSRGSDIELQQNFLSVGFAGANFGFITDLKDVSLDEVNKTTKGVIYPLNYKTPNNEPKAREEQRRVNRPGFDVDGINFQERVPAIVGHTYVIRSVNYETSDVLAAFRVHRKDADGSFIIFWKLIEQFATPSLREDARNAQTTDAQILKQTRGWCRYPNAKAEVNNNVVTLKGKVAKEDLFNIIEEASNFGATKVINLLEVE